MNQESINHQRRVEEAIYYQHIFGRLNFGPQKEDSGSIVFALVIYFLVGLCLTFIQHIYQFFYMQWSEIAFAEEYLKALTIGSMVLSALLTFAFYTGVLTFLATPKGAAFSLYIKRASLFFVGSYMLYSIIDLYFLYILEIKFAGSAGFANIFLSAVFGALVAYFGGFRIFLIMIFINLCLIYPAVVH